MDSDLTSPQKRQKTTTSDHASRYEHLIATLGKELFDKVQESKILVVGAGGIGCELLKNLVLGGFRNIEIIDLDTIDLSNLNRQFLFQRQHIGLSKAQVARESALRFNPDVNIVAHHGNIKSHEFGPDYFRKFTLVLNALDNLDARRHVNRLCIATERPLIESGTAGYHGQVQVIVKGVTECYECYPKPAPKTYAYCTIRSSPKEPIHCVIWAKEEFKTNFGDAADVIKEEEEVSNDAEILKKEQELEKMKEKSFEEWLFHKLFYFDIFRKVRVAEVTNKNLWTERKEPPKPLTLQSALQVSTPQNNQVTAHTLPDQLVWNVKENAERFMKSAANLKARSEKGPLDFDKDDADALDFVTSGSNLRSYIFSIPLQSRFSVKSLAGNIIPAIATTNAVIAGLIVMESLKVLRGKLNECRMTYLNRVVSRGRLLIPSEHEKQNPNCYVCCSNFLTVKVNTKTTTLGTFVDKVLKGQLGLNEPSIIVNNDILFESGEDLDEDDQERMQKQRGKLLTDVKLVHNAIIDVDDNSQNFKFRMSIIHNEVFLEDDQFFEIVGKAAAAPKPAPVKQVQKEPETASNGTDDVMVVEVASRKRKPDRDDTHEKKKQKAKEEADSGVIEL